MPSIPSAFVSAAPLSAASVPFSSSMYGAAASAHPARLVAHPSGRRASLRMTATSPTAQSSPTPIPPPENPTFETYRAAYPLLGEVLSLPQRYTDERNNQWTYPVEVTSNYAMVDGAPPPDVVIVCMHGGTGLGVHLNYWDRYFNLLAQSPDEYYAEGRRTAVVRFDYVGTGTSTPNPDFVKEPYTAGFFVHQVQHCATSVMAHLRATPASTRLILLSQGASEPLALLTARAAPQLVSAVVVTDGLSTPSMTRPFNEKRAKFAYSVLSGPLGLAFWALVANRRYITGFSLKNLLGSDKHVRQWVDGALAGCRDNRSRFNVFSFLSGYFFRDYRSDLEQLGPVKYVFMSGRIAPEDRPSKRLDVQFKSARPPVPIVANEGAFRDDSRERATFRRQHVKDYYEYVVGDSAFEMFFERPEAAGKHLKDFIETKLF